MSRVKQVHRGTALYKLETDVGEAAARRQLGESGSGVLFIVVRVGVGSVAAVASVASVASVAAAAISSVTAAQHLFAK